MLETTRLILKIMHLAYLVHEETSYCVFFSFSGHINSFDMSIRHSQERWQEHVLETEFYTNYKALRDNGVGAKLADLKSKIAVLEQILTEQEISYCDLDYEEEYTRLYSF